MKWLVFIICFLFIFVQCSSPPSGQLRTAKALADEVKADGRLSYTCKEKECCSEHKDCTRICDRIFYKSGKKVGKSCRSLPKDVVKNLEELVLVLSSALTEDLNRLDLSQEFRLLLALDYQVLIGLIENHEVDSAQDFLIWMAQDKDFVAELLQLEEEIRYDILYYSLVAVGDRTRPGAVEEGLAKKISFDKSFFQLLIHYSNYELLQITHGMIKNNLCSEEEYGGESQIELCMLRIYCKEKPDRIGEYIHSEDLRNEMARNIKDEDFFTYVEKDLLHTGPGVHFREPILNDLVCSLVCKDNKRGCE